MKKLNSCFILLPLIAVLFNACDEDRATAVVAETHQLKNLSAKPGEELPDNLANPYDAAGKIHGEILDSYFEAVTLPETMEAIIARVDYVSHLNVGFLKLDDGFYQKFDPLRGAYILSQPQGAVSEIFQNAPLGVAARSSLEAFSGSFLDLCSAEQDYNVIYKHVAQYESLVLEDTTIVAADKRLLLTITSIARHSASKKRRPKKNDDTDWESNIFHIAGGIEGYPSGTASAICTSLALGIAGNR